MQMKPNNYRPAAAATTTTTARKTRDLPNLSECHSCGFRIDVCTGKHKLQILQSEWRFVLLCHNCFALVQSAQICSYCYNESSPINLHFRCSNCKRMIHKDCVSNFANVPPWSYLHSGSSDFSICIDCWLPKTLLMNREKGSSGGCQLKRRKKKFLELRNPKADCELRDCSVLEDVMKEANCEAVKKVEAAKRARELAVEKALVAKRAAKVASDALKSVMKGEGDGGSVVGDGDGDKFVDDFELAFQLHRAMNSSPRISKNLNLCLLNSSNFAARKLRGHNGESMVPASEGKKSSTDSSSKLHCGTFLNSDFLKEGVDSLQSNGIDDEQRGRASNGKRGDSEMVPNEVEGSCSINKLMNSSRGRDISMNSESQQFRDKDESVSFEDEVAQKRPEHNMKKYSRRKLDDGSVLATRPKSFYERLNHEAEAPAAGLQLSCSKESISFSSSFLRSCALSLQTSVCSRGLSHDHS